MEGICPAQSVPFPSGELLALGVDTENAGTRDALSQCLAQQRLEGVHRHHVDAGAQVPALGCSDGQSNAGVAAGPDAHGQSLDVSP